MKTKINRAKLVNRLISNGAWDESDREWLMQQPGSKLLKMNAGSIQVNNTQKPIKPAKEPKTEPVKVEMSFNEILKTADPKVQAMINHGLKSFEKEKEGMVNNILESKLFSFSKEELEAKDVSELGKLIKVVNQFQEKEESLEANWAGNAGAPVIIDNEGKEMEETCLGLPEMKF